MNIRLFGRDLGCLQELRNGLRSLPEPVERLSHQHVSRGGIRTLLQKHPEFLPRTLEFLGRQAALRQHVMEFGIAGISLGRWLKILGGQIELALSLVAHTEKRASLWILRIPAQNGA